MEPLKRINFTIILTVCFVGLALTSCDLLPPEAREELEREYERTVQPLIDEQVEQLRLWAQQQFEQLLEQVEDEVQELADDQIQRAKEWAGLEAPEGCGELSPGVSPETASFVLLTIFRDAYKEAGGGRVIGWPATSVELESGVLIQYFEGGSEGRSAIALEDGTGSAYVIPGEWLVTYEALGGPEFAGYPLSNQENWSTTDFWQVWVRWGRGQRQLYEFSGEEYALMSPDGLENVFVVPPQNWQTYENEISSINIGYPLSGYPLDEDRWQHEAGISERTKDILELWEEQPVRVQVFENGSLIWLAGQSTPEVIEAGSLSAVTDVGTVDLLLQVRNELAPEYNRLLDSGQDQTCYAKSIHYAANAAAQESGEILIPNAAFITLRAALSGTELVVESGLGQLLIFMAQVTVEQAVGASLSEGFLQVLATRNIDSFYSKAIGDILSKPMAELSMIFLEEEYERLSRDRISRQMEILEGGFVNINTRATMDVSVNVDYDPLTRTVSGVIQNECDDGYIFFYRVDPSNGGMAAATQVWDGRVHYISLATGDEVR